MPKKTSYLSKCKVLSHIEISEFLRVFLKKLEFDPKTGRIINHRFGEVNKQRSEELLRSLVLSAPSFESFFGSFDSAKLPAYFFPEGTGYPSDLRFICDNRNLERITEAIRCEHPLLWRESLEIPPIYANRLPRQNALYLFGFHIWEITHQENLLSTDELRLVFLEAIDNERTKFERLKRKFSGKIAEEGYKREPIPEEVRILVWRRDEGKCVRCSSQERLEYDHIIPVSKGGSNTARNIQLLCETCNRQKCANI